VTNEAATKKSAARYWLALGAFAVGSQGLMIAGILPRLAADLSVSLGAAGYLVNLAYHASSYWTLMAARIGLALALKQRARDLSTGGAGDAAAADGSVHSRSLFHF
jgi:predicted MFS family arabinose efflux permease